MYDVIPRMRIADFINNCGCFGTTSISLERLKIETIFSSPVQHNKYLSSDD